MKIKSIIIYNYRKIQQAQINMEDNITILAGANNSGKTSLVELFDSVFAKSKGKLALNKNDFPVEMCEQWRKDVYPLFYNAFTSSENKEKTITEISEKMFQCEKPILISPITIHIQIEYDKEKDDIRNFADYIMELSDNNTSFYFVYKYEISSTAFMNKIDQNYEKFFSRFQKAEKAKKDDNFSNKCEQTISEMIFDLYSDSCTEEAYFCDSSYGNAVHMEISDFKSLFNFGHITASRVLDDERSDKAHILSKSMVDIASQAEDWQSTIKDLPDQIIQPIQNANIQDKVRTASLDPLKTTMNAVSETNGGQAGEIIIDMDITEDSIKSLLKNITSAKYKIGNYYLNESSQGLGYSNLIYIHLQLEKYKKSINPLVVNFFVIEEPEAHMHPQMQNAFSQYLLNYYKGEDNIQGMLTTHSHEVVRNAQISQIRVIRQTGKFTCELYDLRDFQGSLEESDPEVLEFYNFFYTINFPDLIFADKIIMYEGDTERMFIKSILCLENYKALNNQYISFVQVGGAYAHMYFQLLNYLGIKSVILTDLDYESDAKTISDVLSSTITNPTIKNFYKKSNGKNVSTSNPSVEEIYEWQSRYSNLLFGDKNNIYLGFQSKEDGYSRTLEEAMLGEYFEITAIEEKSRKEWIQKKQFHKLKYSIPNKDSSAIRDIVHSTSNGKTDFMYSVIMNNLVNDMLPNYIKEALSWLMK